MGINIGNDKLENIVRPILFSLVLTLIIFLIIYLIVRDLDLSGVMTLILLVAFFSYGHVFRFLGPYRPFGIRLSRNSLLLILYILLIAASITGVIRNRNRIHSVVPYLNWITLGLLILPTFQIISIKNSEMNSATIDSRTIAPQKLKSLPEGTPRPDIYLLVMDGYNREDILKNDLNYDNSTFLYKLRSLGFMVVDCSTGNYNQTMLAMASELNLDYLDQYYPENLVTKDGPVTGELFRNNMVRKMLENSGYQTYSFENRLWPFMNWDDADHPLSSSPVTVWNKEITEFEKAFVESTLLLIPAQYHPEWINYLPGKISKIRFGKPDVKNYPYPYILANFMLDTLPTLTASPSPKFVYAHFAVTHIPFYFNADGSVIDPSFRTKDLDSEKFKEGYTNQLDFINPRLIGVITKILDNSSTPPVIILQSDHGYDQTPERTRFRPNQNFIAIYLPGVHNPPYKSMSSVNIFRYVLKEYFGMDFSYLEDKNYEVSGKDYSMSRIYDLEANCK
jgi:hypothetical protein